MVVQLGPTRGHGPTIKTKSLIVGMPLADVGDKVNSTKNMRML